MTKSFSFSFVVLLLSKLIAIFLVLRIIKSFLKSNTQCTFDKTYRAGPHCYATRTGHTMTVHQLVTKDGYILDIVNLKKKHPTPVKANRTVLFMSSPIGTLAGFLDNKTLEFVDRGFDVWVGGHRGNRYANCHLSLQDQLIFKHVDVFGQKRNYWDFSYHEMGIFDLPAIIDKIQHEKGTDEKIHFVGHALAATAYMIFASLNSSYATQRIEQAFLITPISFVDHNLIGVQGFQAITTLYYYSWSLSSLNYGLYGLKKFCDTFQGTLSIFNVFPLNICSLADVTYMTRNYDFSVPTKLLKHFLQQDMTNFNYYASSISYPLGNIRTPLNLVACSTDIIFDKKSMNVLEDKLSAQNVQFKSLVVGGDCSTLSLAFTGCFRDIHQYILENAEN